MYVRCIRFHIPTTCSRSGLVTQSVEQRWSSPKGRGFKSHPIQSFSLSLSNSNTRVYPWWNNWVWKPHSNFESLQQLPRLRSFYGGNCPTSRSTLCTCIFSYWHICLTSSAKQRIEMTKFESRGELEQTTPKSYFFPLNFKFVKYNYFLLIWRKT